LRLGLYVENKKGFITQDRISFLILIADHALSPNQKPSLNYRTRRSNSNSLLAYPILFSFHWLWFCTWACPWLYIL